jgi:hypothetical protein
LAGENTDAGVLAELLNGLAVDTPVLLCPGDFGLIGVDCIVVVAHLFHSALYGVLSRLHLELQL